MQKKTYIFIHYYKMHHIVTFPSCKKNAAALLINCMCFVLHIIILCCREFRQYSTLQGKLPDGLGLMMQEDLTKDGGWVSNVPLIPLQFLQHALNQHRLTHPWIPYKKKTSEERTGWEHCKNTETFNVIPQNTIKTQ